MKLYEINEMYRGFVHALEAGEVDPEAVADTLEALDGEFEVKAESIACLIKELTAEAEAIKAEKKNLEDRIKSKQTTTERLTNYLFESLKLRDRRKFETSRVALSIAKTPPAVKIEDEKLFISLAMMNQDDTYLRYKDPEIDKAKLREALKAGQVIDGASLESGERLAIK